MRSTYLKLILLLAVCGQGATATADSFDKPLLASESVTLPNGLRLIAHADTRAAGVTICLTYHAGTSDEPSGRGGLAHVVEHIVSSLERKQMGGSDMVSLTEWDKNASTDLDRTWFFRTVPPAGVTAALIRIAENMGNLPARVSAKDLELARSEALNEIRRLRSSAESPAASSILAGLPAGHPYGRLFGGSETDLKSITIDDVRSWLDRFYVPSNASIAIAGNVSPAAAFQQARSALGELPRREAPARSEWHSRPALPSKPVFKSAGRVFTAAWIIPGYAAESLEYLTLIASILDQRLQSPANWGNSGINLTSVDLQVHAQCSYLTVTAGLDEGVPADTAAGGLMKTVEAIAANGATSVELNIAQRRYLLSYLRRADVTGGSSGQAATLGNAFALSGDPAHADVAAARVRRTAITDLSKAARTWLLAAPPVSNQSRNFTRTEPVISGAAPPPPNAFASASLGNGLTVATLRRPGSLAEVRLVWNRPFPLTPTEAALLPITEALLFEGTSAQASAAWRDMLRRLPAVSISGHTDAYSYLGVECTLDSVSTVIQGLGNLAGARMFDEGVLRALTGAVDIKIRTYSQARRLVYDRLPGIFYGPGESGNGQPAVKIDAQLIRSTFLRWFGPSHASVIVIADQAPALSIRQVRDSMENWTGETTAAPRPAVAAGAASDSAYVMNWEGAKRSIVVSARWVPAITSQGIDWDAARQLITRKLHNVLTAETRLSYEAFAGDRRTPDGHILYFLADCDPAKAAETLDVMSKIWFGLGDPAAVEKIALQNAYKQALHERSKPADGIEAAADAQASYMTSQSEKALPELSGSEPAANVYEILGAAARSVRRAAVLVGDRNQLLPSLNAAFGSVRELH